MAYSIIGMDKRRQKGVLSLLARGLLAGAALLLAGCTAPPSGVKQPALPALVFATPESSYRLTAECTRNAQAVQDEAGRAFVEIRLNPSAECSKKAAEAVFNRVGERMSLTYIDTAANAHELNRDTLIASPIDPARALRISVKDEAQAREVAAGLSAR